jgi:hypothetical protein
VHTQVAGNSTGTHESDHQRRKFLETIDAELSASTTHGRGRARLGRSTKLIGSATAALASLATAGTVIMATPTAASAGTCGSPDPRPANQSYACGEGEWFYTYLYKYQEGTLVGRACYVFDLVTFFVGCSQTAHPGHVTVCGRDV